MKRLKLRSVTIAWLLLIVSIVLYGAEYLIFGRLGEIGFGFLGNLAFLPIYVLFVTLMLERIVRERERVAIRQKLNMVIGVFFSEVGTTLLRDCFGFIGDSGELAGALAITPQWTSQDFERCDGFLRAHSIAVDSRAGDLVALREFLVEKRGFMLGLLENPNLLEHDEFTDLLWAVFHLLEELEARHAMDALPQTDLDHLSGDIKRAYSHTLRQWLSYMRHLREDYPYLFSLAVRMNPMNPEARAEIY